MKPLSPSSLAVGMGTLSNTVVAVGMGTLSITVVAVGMGTLSNTVFAVGMGTLSNTVVVVGIGTLSNTMVAVGMGTLSNTVVGVGMGTLSNTMVAVGMGTLSNTVVLESPGVSTPNRTLTPFCNFCTAHLRNRLTDTGIIVCNSSHLMYSCMLVTNNAFTVGILVGFSLLDFSQPHARNLKHGTLIDCEKWLMPSLLRGRVGGKLTRCFDMKFIGFVDCSRG